MAAHRLGLSHSTLKHHLANAWSRVGAETTAQLVWILAPRLPEAYGAYAAVLTGVGPDGVRYVLSGPNGLQGHFVGTIWGWLTAAGT